MVQHSQMKTQISFGLISKIRSLNKQCFKKSISLQSLLIHLLAHKANQFPLAFISNRKKKKFPFYSRLGSKMLCIVFQDYFLGLERFLSSLDCCSSSYLILFSFVTLRIVSISAMLVLKLVSPCILGADIS